MKKRIIKSVILTIVFILAVIGFSAYTNQGDTDMTADMDGATLPTISFLYGDQELNGLVGHKNEMKVSAVRDHVLPYEEGSIEGKLHLYDAAVKSMRYEIYTLDGSALLKEESLSVNDTFTITAGEVLEEGQEGLLKIILKLENDELIYYYTRIKRDADFYIEENLNYIQELHEAILAKTETAALTKGMEPSSEGDNTTLQHVTIHSDMNHVLWCDMEPELVSNVEAEIKEVNASYMSLQLSYRVSCRGDNNDSELYQIKEFFKVCHKSGKQYLLSYDRTMTEIFDANNVVLSGRGIILGITEENVPFKVNSDGTVAAFVLERDLWSYNKNEDEFSLVFSFASSENTDSRNYHDEHDIRILSMEDNGNMTFSVYGYMNRGEHEGYSGLAIYYFNMRTNSIEEKAFISSNDSCLAISEELNKLAYYNSEQDVLYILVEEDLYKCNLTENTTEILVHDLESKKYVTSEDGQMIAYQTAANGNEAVVWDFAEDSRNEIRGGTSEIVIPLGFVGKDFVYGIGDESNVGADNSGQQVTAMHKVEIRDEENQVVKTYEVDGVYILEALVKDNMITLVRAKKSEDIFVKITEDYITNNEETGGIVSMKSYWTDLKETQYRLQFDAGIDNTKTTKVVPKFTLYETLLTFDGSKEQEEYYQVYGCGELAGRFTNAADAVELADDISGVVISPNQRYVWEDGNRVAWYHNFNFTGFVAGEGETSLQACIRKILIFENAGVMDVAGEMSSKSAEDMINLYTSGEAVRFRGASSKEMCYLIDKGTPVVAMLSGTEAVLLIGYDALTVTYVDVAAGAVRSASFEKMDQMTADAGNTYIGYVK